MKSEVGDRILYKLTLTGDRPHQPEIFEEGIVEEIAPNDGYVRVGAWRWRPVSSVVAVLEPLPEEEEEIVEDDMPSFLTRLRFAFFPRRT